MNKKISEIQRYQQVLQQIQMQKQNLSFQLEESKNALQELKKTNNSYKLIGDILVQKGKEELIQETKNKIKNMKSQIESLGNNKEQVEKKIKRLHESLKDDDDDVN